MPTMHRSTFTTAEAALQWVKILVPIATAAGTIIGFVISIAVWKTGVDSKLSDVLEIEKTQGRKLDWIMQHYPAMPAETAGPRVMYPNTEAEQQVSEPLR